MLGQVEIKQNDNLGYDVLVDGRKIRCVTYLELSIHPGDLPKINLALNGDAHVLGMADLKSDYPVVLAIDVLREELLEHGDLYQGFCASILSAINDMPDGTIAEDMPELIMKRIIGED